MRRNRVDRGSDWPTLGVPIGFKILFAFAWLVVFGLFGVGAWAVVALVSWVTAR